MMSGTPAVQGGREGEAAASDWLAGLDAVHPRRAGRRLAALAFASTIAASAVGAGAVAWNAKEPALSATLTAPSDEGGGALFRARLEPRRHRVMLTPADAPAAAGRQRAGRLWLLRVYGPPVALGPADPLHTSTLPIARDLLPADNTPTHLFISLEASDGPPGAYPKGPTVAEGVLTDR